MQQLVDEAAGFPYTGHDGQVDAMTQALRRISRPGPRVRVLVGSGRLGPEFAPRYRCGDVVCDAFLAMDLEYRGFPDFSRFLVRCYARHAGEAARGLSRRQLEHVTEVRFVPDERSRLAVNEEALERTSQTFGTP